VVAPLPAPRVERVGQLLVVRDDLIAGGTKVRVIPQLLVGAREFVYASPAAGYAQISLALACARLGLRATIFCAARRAWHPSTRAAAQAGATIIEVPNGYMTVVRARARAYCAVSGACLLPFGFDCPPFVAGLAAVARALDLGDPPEVWSVAGSGVLTRALQAAWPRSAFVAVRIGAVPKVGRAIVLTAPERFEQVARCPPPFPSSAHYDAKAWRFVSTQARPGAVFWNVGG